MKARQHIEASRRFRDDALALESRGSHMGAAEMIWGATVQALEAIGHIRAGNDRGNLGGNGRRRLAASVISEGVRSYDTIQNDLHAHFYRGHLSPLEYTDRMRRGRDYVAELLSIAVSSAGQ